MKESAFSDTEFLDEYIKPKKTKMQYFFSFTPIILFLILLYILIGNTNKRISVNQLKNSIEVSNIESIWVKNGISVDKGVKRIILVPTISFKIRNVGKTELKFLSIVGVFRFYDTDKFLGEGNKMVFKNGLKPGKISDKIRIVSDRGYRATSVNAFVDNDKEWKTTYVNIFAKLGGYKYVKIKKFNISRRIEGMNLNIKISDPEDKNE